MMDNVESRQVNLPVLEDLGMKDLGTITNSNILESRQLSI